MKIIKTLTQAGSALLAVKIANDSTKDCNVFIRGLAATAASAGGLYFGSMAGEYMNDLVEGLVIGKKTEE